MLGMGASALAWQSRNYAAKKSGVGTREIWGVNSTCLVYRMDKCFSMHTENVMKGECPVDSYSKGPASVFDAVQAEKENQLFKKELEDLHEEYKSTGVPLVTLDGHADTLQYPLGEVVWALNSNYFGVTPAYMIGFAMCCLALGDPAKPKKISCFGFDFDYRHPLGAIEAGKPCVEYWLGRAAARGIIIHLPEQTTLLGVRQTIEDGLYGFGYQQPRFEIVDGHMTLTHFADMPVKGLPEPVAEAAE